MCLPFGAPNFGPCYIVLWGTHSGRFKQEGKNPLLPSFCLLKKQKLAWASKSQSWAWRSRGEGLNDVLGRKAESRHKTGGMRPERVLSLSHLWPLHECMVLSDTSLKPPILKLLVPVSLVTFSFLGSIWDMKAGEGKKGWVRKIIQETFPVHLERRNNSNPQVYRNPACFLALPVWFFPWGPRILRYFNKIDKIILPRVNKHVSYWERKKRAICVYKEDRKER